MTILIISRESVARAEITVIFYVNRRKSILVLRTRAYYRDFLALTDVSSTMYRWMWRRRDLRPMLQADLDKNGIAKIARWELIANESHGSYCPLFFFFSIIFY